MLLDCGGTGDYQPVHLICDGAFSQQVHVKAVLRRLAFGDLDELQPVPTALGVRDLEDVGTVPSSMT